MKKAFFLILFIAFSVTGFAQKIGYKTDNDEELSMGTNYHIENNLGTALEYHSNKASKTEAWGLAFIVIDNQKRISFDKGSKLLIRTFKDTVVQLDEYLEFRDVPRESKKISSMRTRYTAAPRYMIDPSDLNFLISEGIKKMRFDSTTGYIDLEYDKDVQGAILAKQKSIILEESSFTRGY